MTDCGSQRPPRIVSKAEAAAYCRLTEAAFEQLVRAKTLPAPLDARWGWDIAAIDLALDRMSGIDQAAPVPKAGGLAAFIEQRNARKAAEAAARAEAGKSGQAEDCRTPGRTRATKRKLRSVTNRR